MQFFCFCHCSFMEEKKTMNKMRQIEIWFTYMMWKNDKRWFFLDFFIQIHRFVEFVMPMVFKNYNYQNLGFVGPPFSSHTVFIYTHSIKLIWYISCLFNLNGRSYFHSLHFTICWQYMFWPNLCLFHCMFVVLKFHQVQKPIDISL